MGNIFLGMFVSLLTLIAVLNIKKKLLLIICMVLLIASQIYTTTYRSLVNLDNDQQRVQQERIRSYPLTYLNFYFKVLWLKPQDWIEKNPVVIAASRIEENLFKMLNINDYFFGGTPRNNPSDFEKFSFFWLPFFLIGIFIQLKNRNYFQFCLLFLLPLLIFSIWGDDNLYGQIALLPFIVISIMTGINESIKRINRPKVIYGIILGIILSGLILQLNYSHV